MEEEQYKDDFIMVNDLSAHGLLSPQISPEDIYGKLPPSPSDLNEDKNNNYCVIS